MKRFFWLALLFLLMVPSYFSLLKPGIHNIQDSMQYFRIYEMDKCLADGQIPCRWVPDLGYGFGYPLFIYYSPLPYYLGAFSHFVGFSYIDSVKLLIVGGFVVSGLGMYWLIKEILVSRVAALVGSLLYIYAPVRAVQVYVRGSLGEFLAMAVFPFVFLFGWRVLKRQSFYNVMGLGVSIACLLTTHNLMSFVFLPIFTGWIIFESWQLNKIHKLKSVLFGVLIGLGLSAFYVIPILFERDFVHLESMTGGYFDYRQHFVSLYQMFVSNVWGYGSSMLGNKDDLSLSVGQVQWVLTLFGFGMVIINKKVRSKKFYSMIFLGVTALTLMFLMHERSSFIWNIFGFMKIFQFPWRFLVITSFLLSILGAYTISFIGEKKDKLVVVVLGVLLFVMYGKFFVPQKWMNVGDNYFFSKEEFVKQQTASIFDYLPKSANLPPNYAAPVLPEILVGEVKFSNYQKGSNWQSGEAEVYSTEAKVRLPIFDFPGMVVLDNGKRISFDHNDCRGQDYCFGQININLIQGAHKIEVRLTKTLPRIIGDIVSIIVVAGLLIIVYFKRNEN